MKRFKNILAVYGDAVGSDQVFEEAVSLAKDNQARLTLVDIFPEYRATPGRISERRKQMSRLVSVICAEGVTDCSVVVEAGSPYLSVIALVEAEGHDLVIAAVDEGSFLQDMSFGRTAIQLMRKCPCPVWTVKPAQSPGQSRVLACIDPTVETDVGLTLDRQILDFATSLSQSAGAECHVVHAWDVIGKDRDTIKSETPEDTVDLILARHETRYRRLVDRVLSPYLANGFEPTVHLPRMSTQRAITRVVERFGIDLIVMGTTSRTGIAGMLLGNAAETVLHAVSCGVFVVKPSVHQAAAVTPSDWDDARSRHQPKTGTLRIGSFP